MLPTAVDNLPDAVPYTRPITTEYDLQPRDREALYRVRRLKELSEKARKKYEDRWERWYALHLNYSRYADNYAVADDPGRDEIIHNARREFGAELFIPMIYGLIETKVPRLLMNNPKMKVKPRSKTLTRERAEAVRIMFEERQADTDYVLSLIPVARRGLKYGLGVTKHFWDVEENSYLALEDGSGNTGDAFKQVVARVTGQPQVATRNEQIDGPRMEDVEILDWFWDPSAKDMATCRYAIHRTWRDIRYVIEKVRSREWNPVDIEAVSRSGSTTARGQVFQGRESSAGLEVDTDQGKMHEVWEYHDGERIIIILDNQFVVANGPAPFGHGKLPFTIFRPTLQENEFVGIGEIGPIESLQQELNAMRSMRLDNALLVMQKAFIYAEGLVDPADLIIGPGQGIPVQAGDIDQAIRPLNFSDLPQSSYNETGEIKNDMEWASAVNEAVAGQGPAAETATAEQLVHSAAGVRIELQTKMLAHETVKQGTRLWLEEYRQHTLTSPREVMIERPDGYEFVTVTGTDLDLVRAVEPEEDSMAPENTAQKRNDALALNNQAQGYVQMGVMDPRKVARNLLQAFDVPDSETWILPEVTQMNPQVAMIVGQAVKAVLEDSGAEEEDADEVAKDVVQTVMETVGVSQPPASQNGAGPQVGAPAGEE